MELLFRVVTEGKVAFYILLLRFLKEDVACEFPAVLCCKNYYFF